MSLAECLAVALVIGRLQGDLRRVEEVVGEKIASEVVEISDTLGSREMGQRRRLGADAGKHLFGISKFTALRTIVSHEKTGKHTRE